MTMVAQTAPASGRMQRHTVRGGGGLRLHVREWGKPDGPPILFIHGWSQNHLCWAKQYESALADEFRLVAYDLRGHGMSEAPLEPEHYTDGRLWADDVAAIIDAAAASTGRCSSAGPTAPSSSATTCARTAQDRVAAINFVEGAVKLGEAAFGTLIGPGFLDHFVGRHRRRPADQHRARCAPSCRACLAKPLPADDLETALCWNVVVPARDPRRTSRRARSTTTTCCAPSTVPLLVTHGRADTVVLPAMAEHILATCPTAEASWYDGVGHVPHLEVGLPAWGGNRSGYSGAGARIRLYHTYHPAHWTGRPGSR